MKAKLFFWHSKLIRMGYFNLAQMIMTRMIASTGNHVTFYIADGNDDAYESGFAEWLKNNAAWCNHKWRFSATINY